MSHRSTSVLASGVLALFAVFGGVLYFTDALVVTGSDANATIVTGTIALVGAFVAAIVSLVGVVLKHSIDHRTEERLLADAARNAIMQADVESRLKLEAAIRALQLLATQDGKPSLSIQRSGAIFTLQSLGQHDLALSLTAALLRTREIDAGTAAHVLDAALRTRSAESKFRAIEEFVANAEAFITTTGYEIPSSLIGGAVEHPHEVRSWAHAGLVRLLIGRSLPEWKASHRPSAYGLIHALARLWWIETDNDIKADIGAELHEILQAFPDLRSDVRGVPIPNIRVAVANTSPQTEYTSDLVAEIRKWRGAA